MNKPTDAEIDAVLCNHWPAFSMQATLVRIWLRDAMRASLDKWGQPAHSGEPFAWHVCSVNSDGSLSLEHAAAWEEAAHEHINDAITEHDIEGAGSWVVRPAYHAPQPSPAAQGDALSDAVRVPLDSLHADAAYLIGRLREGSMPYARVIEIIRERIDAAKAAIRARAAQEGKTHDN